MWGGNTHTHTHAHTHTGPYFEVEFLGGHHQFSRTLYHKLFDICGDAALKSGKGLSEECQELLQDMHRQANAHTHTHARAHTHYPKSVRASCKICTVRQTHTHTHTRTHTHTHTHAIRMIIMSLSPKP